MFLTKCNVCLLNFHHRTWTCKRHANNICSRRRPKQSCHNFANGCQLLRVAQVSTQALIGRLRTCGLDAIAQVQMESAADGEAVPPAHRRRGREERKATIAVV